METQIRKLLLEDDSSQVTVSPFLSREFNPIPQPPPSSSTTTTLTARKIFKHNESFDSSMALTAVVLLTALFFMGFFSIYIRRFSEDNSTNISRRRQSHRRGQSSPSSSSSTVPCRAITPGLDSSTIQSLPVFAYQGYNTKEAEEEELVDDCAVCLCEFEEKEKLKIIPFCKHVFHPECIDMWLTSHGSCPLCRSTQLFPSLPKRDLCLDVFDDGDEFRERSTVSSGDTSSESETEVSPMRMRRTSSCSSLGERMLLKRSLSF